jgi:hypothetical protein
VKMIDPQLFRENILIPALQEIDSCSTEAEALVLGTCLTESGLRAVRQYNGGPALGLCQMEPATHNDIWTNFLGPSSRQYLLDGLRNIESDAGNADALEWNPFYAVAMCRIHYLRFRDPLPDAQDIDGQAAYWKRNYNSHLGAGTKDDYTRWSSVIFGNKT